MSCSSCTAYAEHCMWNLQTVDCGDKALSIPNRKRFIAHVTQCPTMYLQQSIHRLAYSINKTMTIHLEQCQQITDVHSCQLNAHRKRIAFLSSNATLVRLPGEDDLCLLQCSFELSDADNTQKLAFQRPLHLDLSIQLPNDTSLTVPRTHISLYHCERMALNCTSCLNLEPAFGCTWCNNVCMLKNQTISKQLTCSNEGECLSPVIHTVEPLYLPTHGGTFVTIVGKHFDLFNVSIDLADIPCRLVEEESTTQK